jgi:hypothetical protein
MKLKRSRKRSKQQEEPQRSSKFLLSDTPNKKVPFEIGAFLFYHNFTKRRAFSSVVERSVHIGKVASPILATPTLGVFISPDGVPLNIDKMALYIV